MWALMRVWPFYSGLLAAGTLGLAATLGCSVLVDGEATQCRVDVHCARFGDAACDVAAGICVPRRGQTPLEGAAGGAIDAPLTGSAVDAAAPSHTGANTNAPGNAEACNKAVKPLVTIEREIASDDRLECDKEYLLVGTVLVKGGATLTIAPGTTIRGDKESKGTLVVQPGGRLIAAGTAKRPIVFTSAVEERLRQAGDWGGIILLGRAPVNVRNAKVEGLVEGGEYGGTDSADSSGVLTYVRIEYSGTKLGPNNEINGLTFGGVGSGTVVDFVQVRMTTDDCFEFFGGTVNAKHLVCQNNGDDGFDWDFGYQGKLQFLVLQQDPTVTDETNGFEGDNDTSGSLNEPVSAPTIYNATLCGKGREVDKQQYGLLLRKSTRGVFRNIIASGFEAGIDVRDANTTADLRSSIFFGNLVKNIAYEEDGSDTGAQKDDDQSFDENAWFARPDNNISTRDPGVACFDQQALRLGPNAALTVGAAAPPADGFFDASAAYMGAFRDAADSWAVTPWLVWRER